MNEEIKEFFQQYGLLIGMVLVWAGVSILMLHGLELVPAIALSIIIAGVLVLFHRLIIFIFEI